MPKSFPNLNKNYKWSVLFILTFVYALNYFDRQLIVILQESIKKDLLLSDTQLGLLSGLAFAIFYCTLGVPIAQLADRSNRRNIVAGALAIWSVMTAITGYAQSFIHMLLIRVGVGVGEAGGSPPSHSIISDYFPIEKRATAFAIYSTGLYLGLTMGFLLGGWLDEYLGWRSTFILLGLPGILLAISLLFLVKEPPRGLSEKTPVIVKNRKIKEVFQFLISRKTFIYISCAGAIHSFVGYAFANWMPPFLARVHGMNSMEIGIWLAFAIGLGGGIGAFFGGVLADKLGQKDRRWYMWIGVWAILITLPFSFYTLFSNNKTLALLCYFIPNILFAVTMGPCLSTLQGIVGVNMRALTSAIYYFIINIIGLGLGPLTVGALSDLLLPNFGNESLRWSLFVVGFLEFAALYYFYKAAQTIEQDLDNVSGFLE